METVTQLVSKKSTNVRSRISEPEFLHKMLRTGFSTLSSWAPGLVSRAAERLFFTAQRFPTPERERAILATGHSVDLEIQGEGERVKLACWSWGDGPTVYLLHGWSGRAGQLGAFVEPLLRAGYSVVAFDTPAHGQSTGKVTSAPTFSRALSQVIGRFGPAHAVIAHSMGGWAAAHALLGGASIDRLVLIGSPTDPSAFTAQFADRFGLTPAVIHRMMERACMRLGFRSEEFKLADRISRDSRRGEVGALIVHDRVDAEVPYANAEAWIQGWPEAQLITTEGLGHRKILRDSRVIEQVMHFIGDSGSK